MTMTSISEIALLTGFSRETITRRLVDIPPVMAGAAKTYETKTVLPLLYDCLLYTSPSPRD